MNITIAVFFGGNSTEHEISVISAIQAMGYLDHEKYRILPVYMTKQNLFYTHPDMERIENFRDIPALLSKSRRVFFLKEENRTLMVTWPFRRFGKNESVPVDLAFPIVHGTNVEDGTLQGFLATLGLPIIGPGVLPSALGMDKAVMKSVFKDHGIPVLPCRVCTRKDWEDPDALVDGLTKELPWPMIVKPVNLGSSIGITKAGNAEELRDALDLAFTFSEKVLVERAIEKLKEVNCAVLGDYEGAEASECEEPLSSDEESILSFEDKYLSGGKSGAKTAGVKGAAAGEKGGSKGMASLQRKIPAQISDEMRDRVRETAVRAFQALDGAGVARIDFMIDEATGELFLNEINTIPGSLSFYLWEPLGVPYAELLERLIALALKRAREAAKTTTAFDTNILATVKIPGGTKTK
ncbi:MAG: D-alanine--D-alanine ligase [Lachnospiraceae bacterium]|nr:D-alanine--D-alanine ligase [Lachnospiraceae bacterium]